MDKNLTIAAYITEFVNQRATSAEPTFFISALHEFVRGNSGKIISTSTVDRILRRLRAEGKVNYAVINRTTSYYLAKRVGE